MSWNLEDEKYTISYNCEVVRECSGQITAADVRETAIELGIKNLGVTDTEGEELEDFEFPVQENIVIYQVNKAG